MLEDLRIFAITASIAWIIIFTARGCYYCWQGLMKDRAGLWITVSEAMTATAWTLIGVDALLARVHVDAIVIGIIFWIAIGLKVVSTILKSDMGFKVIRDTYRGFRDD